MLRAEMLILILSLIGGSGSSNASERPPSNKKLWQFQSWAYVSHQEFENFQTCWVVPVGIARINANGKTVTFWGIDDIPDAYNIDDGPLTRISSTQANVVMREFEISTWGLAGHKRAIFWKDGELSSISLDLRGLGDALAFADHQKCDGMRIVIPSR